MIQFFLVGAGGGGGGGFLSTGSTATSGGGGGGGGAQTKLLIPAIFLPDELYVNIGVGGAGGVNGVSGGTTYVDLINGNNTSATLIAYANGGSGGTYPATGSGTITNGGAGGVASTAGDTVYTGLGLFSSVAGGAGGNGSGGTTALAGISTATSLTSGGGGGGSRNAANTRGAPAGITGNNVFLPNVTIRTVTNSDFTTYGGVDGVYSVSPFQSYGGAGAHSTSGSNVTTLCGGVGGNGLLGSGGGGGGGKIGRAHV